LSQKRAESAVTYMVNRGIDKSRVIAKGYGETRLKNKCADGVECSEAEHQANRRSEVTIIEM
ncbi:OmpA family protein, partial [Plebeiibacterium sediminum]